MPNDQPNTTLCPEPMWKWVSTIKVARDKAKFAAWEDNPNGILVHGTTLAETLQKFAEAKDV